MVRVSVQRAEPPQVPDEREDALAILLRAVDNDEVIRRAIRITALKALQHANEMLDVGSVANRVTVIRSMMPALVKTLERKETEDELTKLKEELQNLMVEVRSGARVDNVQDDVLPDGPP